MTGPRAHVTIGVMLALVAGPALATPASPQRFDLVCRGVKTVRGAPEPFRQTIHVDLDRNAYCVDACKVFDTIKNASKAAITFRDKPSDGYYLTDKAMWDRQSGAYTEAFAATFRMYYESSTRAQCTVASYTAGKARR